MEEIQCPMCGNPNPGGAETCEHCGARLTPLVAGDSDQESSDWLEGMRREAGDESTVGAEGIPRGYGLDSTTGDADEGASEFDALRVEAEGAGAGFVSQEGGSEASEPEDAGLDPEDAGLEPEGAGLEPEDAGLDALRAGLESHEPPATDEPQPADEPEPRSEPEPADEGETPEWLRRIREKQATEPEEEPAEEVLRAQEFGARDPEEEPAEEVLRAQEFGARDPKEEPAEEDLREQEFDAPPPEEEPAEEVLRAQQFEAPDPEMGPADEPIDESAADAEETPSWLEEVETEPAEDEGTLPHVPALVGGPQEPAEAESEDLDLPDWLGEIETLEDEPAPEPAPEGPDLAPATLPSWLEAMRPVETFRSVVEMDSEEEQAVESVGPLAGLTGVLLAEPVVAMPRTSSIGSMELDVSERQYAQAELLHRLVDEEESEPPAARKRGPRLAVFRWGIAAFMLIAVSLPAVTGAPSFALPSLEPQELGALFELVEGLPAEAPTLIVFDYEAGYSGELEAVSGPLLDQIMGRGLLVASMSTIPSGSPMAHRAIDTYGSRHGYENGQDYVHLGYLSGGPTAVQLFAVNPREAILEGFALPEQIREEGLTAWESPVLSQVQSLSDFGMVAVVTSGAETARVWAEQARPRMGETPLVVVLTAGAEPLIRPYFESQDEKVGGILSGLPAAATYELRNGRLGLAQERWNTFGTGMIAAEIVLLAGIGYGLVNWWLARGSGRAHGNV